MEAHLMGFPLLIFFFPKPGDGREKLLEVNALPALSFNALLALFFLVLIGIVGYYLFRARKMQRRSTSRQGCNHPAIPSPVYEYLQMPKPPKPTKGGKGKAPQKQSPPLPPAVPREQEELPDAYTFYSQLDQLEED